VSTSETPLPPQRRRSRAELARWRTPAALLALLAMRPGITRARAARVLRLSSGAASELVARLRAAHLLDERPATPHGRGRPTTELVAHPEGPLIVVVDIRHEQWQVSVSDLTVQIMATASRHHRDRAAPAVVSTLAAEVSRLRRRFGTRLRAVSVSVPATLRGEQIIQASGLGWHDVDLSALRLERDGTPLLVGNNATLAGGAEARLGAGGGARVLLHLTVEVGIGGILVTGGVAATGSTGAGGEFGHLPLGTPGVVCPCGALGCWDMDVDGRAMARRRGEPEPADPRAYASAMVAAAAEDASALGAVEACARSLGAGAAGLVNALDPDRVTLGGLATELHALAGDALTASYHRGLMRFRRREPPPLLPAQFGDDGPAVGAALAGIDLVTSEAGLASWVDRDPHADAVGRRPVG
jgi:predicted NBD/HSP70 family sugar kinase